jgi:hypothetical protein
VVMAVLEVVKIRESLNRSSLRSAYSGKKLMDSKCTKTL